MLSFHLLFLTANHSCLSLNHLIVLPVPAAKLIYKVKIKASEKLSQVKIALDVQCGFQSKQMRKKSRCFKKVNIFSVNWEICCCYRTVMLDFHQCHIVTMVCYHELNKDLTIGNMSQTVNLTFRFLRSGKVMSITHRAWPLTIWGSLGILSQRLWEDTSRAKSFIHPSWQIFEYNFFGFGQDTTSNSQFPIFINGVLIRKVTVKRLGIEKPFNVIVSSKTHLCPKSWEIQLDTGSRASKC